MKVRNFARAASSTTCTTGTKRRGLSRVHLGLLVLFALSGALLLAAPLASRRTRRRTSTNAPTTRCRRRTRRLQLGCDPVGQRQPRREQVRLLRGRLDPVPDHVRQPRRSASSHTVTIEWDTTKSGKHAIDYLTTFNRAVANANPCLGVSGCDALSFSTFAIPGDPQVTGAGVTPNAGSFTMYGGTITSVSAYSYSNGAGFTGDKSREDHDHVHATSANPVLAWGGHIATRQDWGVNNSAVAISGSPYHTRLIDLDGSGGNQDRSLSADAVIFPGSVTIIKHATTERDGTFGFTARARRRCRTSR